LDRHDRGKLKTWMSVWPVFVANWQQESGGQPFAVGDAITWPLVLMDGRREGWPEDLLVDARFALSAYPEWSPWPVSIATAGQLSASWDGPEPLGSELELYALLLAELHSRPAVETSGTVNRIRVLTQRFERQPDGVFFASWHDWTIEDLDRAPEWFDREDDVGPKIKKGFNSAVPIREQTGLLVDLDTDPPAREP